MGDGCCGLDVTVQEEKECQLWWIKDDSIGKERVTCGGLGVTVQEEKGWQLWWISGDSNGGGRVTVVVDQW